MDNTTQKINKAANIMWVGFFILLIIYLFWKNIILGFIGIIVISLVWMYRKRINFYLYTANRRYNKGNLKGALSEYEKIIKNPKCIPAAKLSYAYMLLRDGQIEKAEEVVKDVKENNELDTQDLSTADSHLALILWKKGEIDEAISYMEGVFERTPNTANYGTLGYYYILKGDLDRALEFNKEAYEYNPKNAVIADNLGLTYYMLGEYDKSLEIYKEIFEKKVNFPEAYYNYGLVLKKTGNTELAKEMLDTASTFTLSSLSTISKEDILNELSELQ